MYLIELSGRKDMSNHWGEFRICLTSVCKYFDDFILFWGEIFWLLVDDESESSLIFASVCFCLWILETDFTLRFCNPSEPSAQTSTNELKLSGSHWISGDSSDSSLTLLRDFILQRLIELCFYLTYGFLIECIKRGSEVGVDSALLNFSPFCLSSKV